MSYTSILQRLNHPDQRYIGSTSNLRNRLSDHNAHRCSHTKKYAPRKVKLYLAERRVLEKRKQGKQMIFVAPMDLSVRLLDLEKTVSR